MKRNYIEINDRSADKDQQFADFFKESETLHSNKRKRRLESDADFESLFIDLVEEFEPASFSAFKEKVASVFKNKLDDRLNRWENKLALDRSKLKEIFYGHWQKDKSE